MAGITLDTVRTWRFQALPTLPSIAIHHDIAVIGNRAYAIEEGTRGDGTVSRLVAIGGVPPATDCDTSAPAVGVPSQGFLVGRRFDTTATLSVWWTATDTGSGIARHELRRIVDGGPAVLVADGLSAANAAVTVQPGQRNHFAVRTVDRAGNTGSRSGPDFVLRVRDDRHASIRYAGSWKSTASSSASGGTLRRSSTAGATASLTFIGRAVAWVAPVGPNLGSADVLIVGRRVATVNLYRKTASYRQVVWSRSWTTAGSHTLTIRVKGTSGHPRVGIDAILILV
jgi:hypothetical protein